MGAGGKIVFGRDSSSSCPNSEAGGDEDMLSDEDSEQFFGQSIASLVAEGVEECLLKWLGEVNYADLRHLLIIGLYSSDC